MATAQGKDGFNPLKLIGALLPLGYFGGLIYYFTRVGGGTIQGIVDIGLGPTVAGLTIIGLLFCIQPLLMLFRLLMPKSAPRAARADAMDDTAPSGDFDADDAIARYLAKRGSTEPAPIVAEPSTTNTESLARPSFGRKSI
jgi:hypothetical protein